MSVAVNCACENSYELRDQFGGRSVRNQDMPSEEEPLDISSDMLEPTAPDPHGGRVDFERGMSYAPRLTLILIVLLFLIFSWQVRSGGLASAEGIVAVGALVRERVLAGEWWRLISATFLHGGVEHIAGNVISLYILGMACEHAFGQNISPESTRSVVSPDRCSVWGIRRVHPWERLVRSLG
jgi:membrane associated rhomboid family serine protease